MHIAIKYQKSRYIPNFKKRPLCLSNSVYSCLTLSGRCVQTEFTLPLSIWIEYLIEEEIIIKFSNVEKPGRHKGKVELLKQVNGTTSLSCKESILKCASQDTLHKNFPTFFSRQNFHCLSKSSSRFHSYEGSPMKKRVMRVLLALEEKPRKELLSPASLHWSARESREIFNPQSTLSWTPRRKHSRSFPHS